MIEVGSNFINALVVGIVGWLFYSLRKLSGKVDSSISEDRVNEIIASRIAELKVRQEEMIKDVMRLESKIDYLLELHLRSLEKRSSPDGQ